MDADAFQEIKQIGLIATTNAAIKYQLTLDTPPETGVTYVKIMETTPGVYGLNYHWTKTNVEPGDTWYVVPFMKYDSGGDSYLKYGPLYSVTANSDSTVSITTISPSPSNVVYDVLNNKVDKETGKGLSTNDYTTTEKDKLAGIEEGATKTIVDTNLSSTSTNPVQNKTVKAAIDSKADATIMNAVGLRLVASNVQQSNDPYTYQMSKDDFDKSELGTYIISIVTWSTTPKYSLYAVSYTGNTLSRTLIVKIAGDDMTITVENGVISVSGLPSYGGKISIHALQ